jgi:Ni/Co efflux regulator RcnB
MSLLRTAIASMILGLATTLAAAPAHADPQRHGEHHNGSRNHDSGRHHSDHRSYRHDDRRGHYRPAPHRYHGHHGYDGRRGYGHPRWVRGYRYAGPRYVVYDYGSYRLRPPPRGYRWVRADNDFLLIAIATGVILDIATN